MGEALTWRIGPGRAFDDFMGELETVHAGGVIRFEHVGQDPAYGLSMEAHKL